MTGWAAMIGKSFDQSRWGWLVLFASSTTLICCALPILLVSVGLGAVSAAMFSGLPILVELARHKALLFSGSGAVLALAAWSLFRPGRSCPVDPALRAKCEAAERWNKRLLTISAAIWGIGFLAAYLSLSIMNAFERLTAP